MNWAKTLQRNNGAHLQADLQAAACILQKTAPKFQSCEWKHDAMKHSLVILGSGSRANKSAKKAETNRLYERKGRTSPLRQMGQCRNERRRLGSTQHQRLLLTLTVRRGVVLHDVSEGAASRVPRDADVCIDCVRDAASLRRRWLLGGAPAAAAAAGARVGAVRHLRATRPVRGAQLVALVENAVVVRGGVCCETKDGNTILE